MDDHYGELGDLVSAMCDGSLTDTQSECLAVLLRRDAKARAFYINYLTVHGVLAWDLSSLGDRQSLAITIPGEAPSVLALQPTQAAFQGSLADQPTRWRLLGSRTSARWLAVAATVALMCWSGLAIWVFPKLRGLGAQDEHPMAVVKVGKLVGEVDCAWVGDQQLEPGDDISLGDLSLSKGTAEVRLDSGVRLFIAGPTRLLIDDVMATHLRSGALTASVPPQAVGYTVTTPTATIVDLGTEFGVLAKPSGETDIQVFKGRVSVQPLAKQSSSRPPAIVLTAGESKRVKPDEATGELIVTKIAATRTEFARKLPQVTSPKHSFPGSLVAYWNFDEKEGPVWDERGKNHGVLEGAERVAGLVGPGALRFDNQPGQQVRVPARTSDLEFTDALTIEAVFVSSWSGKKWDYDELFRKEDGNRLLLAFQNDDDQGKLADPKVAAGPVLSFGLTIGGVYHELDMLLDGQEGRPSLAEMTDGKPHHVVAVYTSRSGEKAIYIDGKFRFGKQYSAGSKLASGGTQPSFIGALAGSETFAGVLDELAIYRQPLTPEEIARHWKNAQRRRSYFELPSLPKSHETSH